MKYIEILKAEIKRGENPSDEELAFRNEQAALQANNELGELKMQLLAEKDAIRRQQTNVKGALDFKAVVALKKQVKETEALIEEATALIAELF